MFKYVKTNALTSMHCHGGWGGGLHFCCTIKRTGKVEQVNVIISNRRLSSPVGRIIRDFFSRLRSFGTGSVSAYPFRLKMLTNEGHFCTIVKR